MARACAAVVAAPLVVVVMAFASASALAATATATGTAPLPAPHASVSPGSLSFKVEVNEFNNYPNSIDSDPQTVMVTNTGTAPLSISAVKIVKSAGGFVINNACVATLVNDKYTFTCTPPTGPADTCSGATLAVGASCRVSVEYKNAGVFKSASGLLEIDSNSPTSPDLVSLSGTSTFITAVSIGAVPGGCPGVIQDTQSANPNTSAGSGINLGGCWASVGPGGPGATANSTWGAVGPVTIDGDVTLSPTSPGDELWVSPSFAGGTANDTIYATPSTARYVVMVAPPATLGAAGAAADHVRVGGPAQAIDSLTIAPGVFCATCQQASWWVAGPNTEPLGVVDLGANPFVCSHPWEDALAPGYVGCQGVLPFGADSPPDMIHGLPIAGGDIAFGSCGSESVVANAALPSLFSSTSVAGSPPPTVRFFFAGCKPPPPTSSGGSSPGPINCSGALSTTPACGGPRGTIIPPTPKARDAGPGRVHVASARARLAPRIAGGDPSCPSGDVDYTASTPGSFVGAMNLGSPFLCYDPIRDVWTAGGTVGIGSASVNTGPPPDFGIGFHSDGSFDHGGIQSVNFNPGLPLAPAVTLDAFGGSFGLDPTRLQASATVTVARVLHITGGAFAVWANPSHPYTYQPFAIPGVANLQTDTQPPNQLTDFAAGVGGTVSLDEPVLGTIQLASGYVFYAAPSYFEFAGCLGDCTNGLSLLGGVVSVFANVQGALDTGNGQYNVGGLAKVCANFPIAGQQCPAKLTLDASNQGFGACGSFLGITGGVITSGGDLHIVGGLSPSSCDLGPITVVVQRSHAVDEAVAHIAQAGAAVTLNLTGHPPSTSIFLKGTGGPPVLSLAGPDGERLSESSSGQGVYDRRLGLVIWPEPKLDETVVSIDRPTSGAWTLTPLPGSATISSVSYANAMPPARVTATVSGRGRALTLSYRVRRRVGQRVTFAERAGRVFRVLGVARGTHGKLRFTSALGPGGRREIVAEISLAGMPTRPLVVARYMAPPPPRAGRPSRLTLGRRGRSLSIRWGKAANAGSYLCVVSLSDGLRTVYVLPARRRSKILPTVAPNVSGRISIIPMTAMGAPGPDITAPLTSVRPPAAVKRLTITQAHTTVVVTWQRSAGASRYMLLLRLDRPRATIYAPVLLRTTRFVSNRTLPNLRPGTVATVTIVALGPTGAQSTASSIHYRAS